MYCLHNAYSRMSTCRVLRRAGEHRRLKVAGSARKSGKNLELRQLPAVCMATYTAYHPLQKTIGSTEHPKIEVMSI